MENFAEKDTTVKSSVESTPDRSNSTRILATAGGAIVVIGTIVFFAFGGRGQIEPETTQPTVEPMEEAVEEWDAEVSTSVAALRTGPDSACEVVVILNKGDKVKLSAVIQDKDWVEATGPNHASGWLPVDKLKLYISLDELEVK